MTVTVPEVDLVTPEVIRSAMETICFEMATFVSRTATTPILNQSNERNATILDARADWRRCRWASPSSCCRSTLARSLQHRLLRRRAATRRRDRGQRPLPRGRPPPRFQRVRARVLDDEGRAGADRLHPVPPRRHRWGHGRRLQRRSPRTSGPRARAIHCSRSSTRARNGATSCSPCGPTTAWPGSSATSAPRSAPPSSGVERLAEIIDQYGADAVKAAVDFAIDDARRRFTSEIAGWPDGTYESDVYVDADPAGQPGHPRARGRDRRRRPSDRRLRRIGRPPRYRRPGPPSATPGATPSPSWLSLVDPSIPKNEGFFDCIELRVPLGLLPEPGGGQAGEQRAPTIPVSRWATPSPWPCPRSSPTAAPPRPTSTAAPVRCGATSIRGPASPFFDHGGEVNAGWVNAVRGVDGWGAPAAARCGNLIKASAEINEHAVPALPPRPQLHHRLRGRRASGGGVRSHFVKEVRTPTSVNQYVVNQRHTHPGIAGGHNGSPGRLFAEAPASPSDRSSCSTLGRRTSCSRPAIARLPTSVAAAAGATRSQRTPSRCSTTSGTSTSRSTEPGATTAWSSPDPSRRWISPSTTRPPSTVRSELALKERPVVTGDTASGVDVGGTFTDCVLLRPDGTVVLEKTPTTPADQSDGVLAGPEAAGRGRGARGRPVAAGTLPSRSCTAPPPATTP